MTHLRANGKAFARKPPMAMSAKSGIEEMKRLNSHAA